MKPKLGRRASVLIWTLAAVAAVAVNVVEFPLIEGSAGPWYGAIPEYSSSDPAEIIPEHMEGVQAEYGLDYRLAAFTDEPVITVFPGSGLEDRPELWMAASVVEVLPYSPGVDTETARRLSSSMSYTGTDALVGDYGLALWADDEPARHVIAVRDDGMLILADSRLLPAGFLEGSQ